MEPKTAKQHNAPFVGDYSFKPKSPIDGLLGASGEPVKCVDKEPISCHWFETKARKGDRCLCGKTVKR